MKTRKNNNGFTLVELIVVIAIIGILAAVLIPSISGYIDKAHRGKDVELAGNMTTELSLYATEYNINMDDLTGVDVRTILTFNGHNLKPRKNDWIFAYDRTTNRVVVLDLSDEVFSVSIQNESMPLSNPIDPTHFHDRYFLISKGNSNLEKAVDLITNLESYNDYTTALELAGEHYSSLIRAFDPSHTIYISNSDVFTSVSTTGNITRVVILEQTSSLPLIESSLFSKISNTLLNSNIKFSNTVRTSEPDSLLKNIIKGTKDIDLKKVHKINLAAFGTNASGDAIYKMDLGPYFEESFKQVISDKIISVTKRNDTEYVIQRKLTISYFNKEGLFASGSIIYAVLQNKPVKPNLN